MLYLSYSLTLQELFLCAKGGPSKISGQRGIAHTDLMDRGAKSLRELLRDLAGSRSRRSVSIAAGLNVNYFGDVLAGKATPRHEHLLKLLDVLNATPEQREQAIRLAGYHFEPGQAEADIAARRHAWAKLFHIVINQVLVPRGELEPLGYWQGTLAAVRDDALTMPLAWFQSRLEYSQPPAPALELVEARFAKIDEQRLSELTMMMQGDLSIPVVPQGVFHPERHRLFDWLRVRMVALLSPTGPRPPIAGWTLTSRFDEAFAIAMFARLVPRAALAWPFEKFRIALALRGDEAQRLLWDAIRDGLPAEGVEEAMLGRGPLGAKLVRCQRRRPSIERFAADGLLFGFHRVRPQMPGDYDAVFDHFDRCEFIDKFALVRADPDWAVDEARLATRGPYWQALEDHLHKCLVQGPPQAVADSRDFGNFRIYADGGLMLVGRTQILPGGVSVLTSSRAESTDLANETIVDRRPTVCFFSPFVLPNEQLRFGPGAGASDGVLWSTHVVRSIADLFEEGVRSALAGPGLESPWKLIRKAAATLGFSIDPPTADTLKAPTPAKAAARPRSAARPKPRRKADR
ncbi:MAG: hypothetical protein SF069_17655 [Phycisphaerae bacterium]|nr:hypothetical protein [Phycisphaerae bacterium]